MAKAVRDMLQVAHASLGEQGTNAGFDVRSRLPDDRVPGIRRRSCFAVVAMALVCSGPAAHAALVIEDVSLSVAIRGRPHALEAMIVRSDEFSGRLPVALLAHGSPGDRN